MTTIQQHVSTRLGIRWPKVARCRGMIHAGTMPTSGPALDTAIDRLLVDLNRTPTPEAIERTLAQVDDTEPDTHAPPTQERPEKDPVTEEIRKQYEHATGPEFDGGL